MEAPPPLPSGDACMNSTMRSASGYVSGLRSTVSTTVKIALLMPMPSARAATAKPVNPGLVRNMRTACLKLSQKSLIASASREHCHLSRSVHELLVANGFQFLPRGNLPEQHGRPHAERHSSRDHQPGERRFSEAG